MEGFPIRRTAKNLREQIQSPARQRWGTAPPRIYAPVARRILLPMTRHKHTHTGLVTPQLPQLLLTAVLHLFAMLASSVRSTLQMIIRRPPVIGTQAMPADLPRETSDTSRQETYSVAASDGSLTRTTTCHPGSAQRYPGTIDQVGRNSQWVPALRFVAAGMTPQAIAQEGSVPKVRVPGEGRGPVLLKQEARRAPRIPLRLLDPRLRGECVQKKRT